MTSTATQTDPPAEPAAPPSRRDRLRTGTGGIIGGFRTFILRGNIIELAVGVVIGVAFNTLVAAFTADFIQPLIKVFSGGKKLAGTFTIRHQVFDWAHFVNAVVNFLLVAIALYFIVVLPMNKVNERRARLHGDNAPPAVPDDIALLTEIRDALVEANRRAAPAGDAPAVPSQSPPPASGADAGQAAPPTGRRARPSDGPPAR